MSYHQKMVYIQSINDQFRYYKSIESLFELDMWSALPEQGSAYRQQMAAYVAQQKANLFASEDARQAARYFHGVDLTSIEDDIQRGLIRTFLSRYRNATNTPAQLTRQYSLLKADAMHSWKQARQAQNFQIFLPYLEQVFSLKKQIALAIHPDAPAFDTLVDINDEGADCALISREFDVLKVGLQNLVAKIQHSGIVLDGSLLAQAGDPDQVEAFSQRLAREVGYQESRGGFNNRVVHAFTSFMGPQDARVSTARGGSFNMMFTCLHEAGHAMYASGGNDQVNAANMWGGIEGSFHEAMARFYENMVGRSKAYWAHYYPQLQASFSQFAGVPLDEFYRAMNAVKPSLRRIAADEVTYSLHVILRYELERDYFAGTLAAKDLAQAWNDKSEQYLGIRPSNDTEGVLQDMHWAGDYIGYFQSYALGNLYGGQLMQAIQKDIPQLDEQLKLGRLNPLGDWMGEHVCQYGCCLTAGQLAQRLSGTELDARPFLSYLEEKYRELYHL